MAMEAAAESLIELLKERGYTVAIRREKPIELEVAKGGVSACVALVGRSEFPDRLYVRIGCERGISVIECSDTKRVAECVDRLLKALEATSVTASSA